MADSARSAERLKEVLHADGRVNLLIRINIEYGRSTLEKLGIVLA